jgi:hypothetical protein
MNDDPCNHNESGLDLLIRQHFPPKKLKCIGSFFFKYDLFFIGTPEKNASSLLGHIHLLGPNPKGLYKCFPHLLAKLPTSECRSEGHVWFGMENISRIFFIILTINLEY